MYISGLGLLESKVRNFEDIKNMLPFVFILGSSIIPLIEETVHRLYISCPNKVVLSIVFLFLYFIMLGDYTFYRIFVFFAYFIFILVIVKIPLFQVKTIFIFTGSSFFFAVFHIFKYLEGFEGNMIHLMVGIVPQFLTGLVLCYVHLKLGFGWGVVHHGMVNLILVLFIYMLI
ncbi:hypothetical protein QWY93_01090 [Echinicola jeungdonensis]|nr:hypothetical protein [Echinicola jeungdonensis]MDN3667936.1 hypothetical protein [Echinicola jeungdonensis]